MRTLVAAAVASLACMLPLAAHAAVGDQRILVVPATWGPEPFTHEELVASFAQASAFFRTSSFGQLRLTGDVAPTLRAYTGEPGCPSPEVGLTVEPEAAVRAAGIALDSYDRVVYVIPRMDCPWDGVALGTRIVLNGSRNWFDLVHELGHTYGLAHARSTTCDGCPKEEYGDPFSPMGHGQADFSAYEKVQMGWMHEVRRVSRTGTYALGRPDVSGATPYALVVTTAAREYWLEQRVDVTPPGLIVRTIEPDEPNPFAPPTLLHYSPAPTLGRGETYRVAGVFSVRYGDRVRFQWLDRKRPAPPAVSARGANVTWSARDGGSGIASCTVKAGARTVARGAARGTATVRGARSVSVSCVDRAGNRSRATVKRLG
jgi:hypothetical protein